MTLKAKNAVQIGRNILMLIVRRRWFKYCRIVLQEWVKKTWRPDSFNICSTSLRRTIMQLIFRLTLLRMQWTRWIIPFPIKYFKLKNCGRKTTFKTKLTSKIKGLFVNFHHVSELFLRQKNMLNCLIGQIRNCKDVLW